MNKKIKIILVLTLILSINFSVLAESKAKKRQSLDEKTNEKVMEYEDIETQRDKQTEKNEQSLENEQKSKELEDKSSIQDDSENLIDEKIVEKEEVTEDELVESERSMQTEKDEENLENEQSNFQNSPEFKEIEEKSSIQDEIKLSDKNTVVEKPKDVGLGKKPVKKDTDENESGKTLENEEVIVSNGEEFGDAYNNSEISKIQVKGLILVESDFKRLKARNTDLEIEGITDDAGIQTSRKLNLFPLSKTVKEDRSLTFKKMKIDAPRSRILDEMGKWKVNFDSCSNLSLKEIVAQELQLKNTQLWMKWGNDSDLSSIVSGPSDFFPMIKAQKITIKDSKVTINNHQNQKGFSIFENIKKNECSEIKIVDSEMFIEVTGKGKVFNHYLEKISKISFEGDKTEVNIITRDDLPGTIDVFHTLNKNISENRVGSLEVKKGAKVNIEMNKKGKAVSMDVKNNLLQVDGKGSELNINYNLEQAPYVHDNIIYLEGLESLLEVSNQAHLTVKTNEIKSSPTLVFFYLDEDNREKIKGKHRIHVNKGSKLMLENNTNGNLYGISGIGYGRVTSPKIKVEDPFSDMTVLTNKGLGIGNRSSSPHKPLILNIENQASFVVESLDTHNGWGSIHYDEIDLSFIDARYYDIINRSNAKAQAISSSRGKIKSENTFLSFWESGTDLNGVPSESSGWKDIQLTAPEHIKNYARLQGRGQQKNIEAKETFVLFEDFIQNIKNDNDLIEYMNVKAYQKGEEEKDLEVKVLERGGLCYDNPLAQSYVVRFAIKDDEAIYVEQKIHIFPHDYMEQNDEYLILANDFYDGHRAYLENDAYFIDKADAKAYRKDDLEQELIVSLKPHNISKEADEYTLSFYIKDEEDVETSVLATILDRNHVVETKKYVIAANDFRIMEYEAVNILNNEIVQRSKAYGFNKAKPSELLGVEVISHDIKPKQGRYNVKLAIKK